VIVGLSREDIAMHAPVLPAVPAPTLINRPTVPLTEKGANLLALLTCREALPASSTTVAAVLDRRIAEQFGDAGAD